MAATTAAAGLLIVAGAGAWSRPLGGSLVRGTSLAAVAALTAVTAVTAAGAAGRLPRWLAGRLLAVWVPAGLLAAGVPAGQLLPPAWPTLVVRLGGGVQQLATPTRGPLTGQSWPLAAWLLLAGAAWLVGAVLAAPAPASTRQRALAFGMLAAPWLAAVVRHSDQAAWQGAASLLAGLLWWCTAGRVPLRSLLALGLAAALASVGITQVVGPRTRWFTPASSFRSTPPSWTLQTEPTYGPPHHGRDAATMLEVTAAQPVLWRMQILSLFFASGWRIGYEPELPQPAAHTVQATVVVRGLGNDLLVAPGRIQTVHAHGSATPAPGEAWQLSSPPHRGDRYQVRASVVQVTAAQLQAAPLPTDPRLRSYTRLTPSYDGHPVTVPLLGQPPDPSVATALARTPYGPVAALARQLAAGASTQWEVVARVHHYLLDGGRFHYTTRLPEPGLFPLVDFLLRSNAGACQQFAGAAALLLRLAGVPARVAVGFATGLRQRNGHFQVRGADAHAWIEVYFQGDGWVTFNPTPPAADSPHQSASANPAGRHDHRGSPDRLAWLVADAILAALVIAGVWGIRRRARRRPAPLGWLLERLERLVHRAGGHVEPSSTLTQLGGELARLVGPHTAALATQAEHARFAPDPAPSLSRPQLQLVRALTTDLGPSHTLLLLIAPTATRRAHKRSRRPRHADAMAGPLTLL
jgi:protein-glutamine gamma-glutamyltransferase